MPQAAGGSSPDEPPREVNRSPLIRPTATAFETTRNVPSTSRSFHDHGRSPRRSRAPRSVRLLPHHPHGRRPVGGPRLKAGRGRRDDREGGGYLEFRPRREPLGAALPDGKDFSDDWVWPPRLP